jgi:DNA-binding NtrC family response regulator
MLEDRLNVRCIFETNPENLEEELLKKVDLLILDYYFGTIQSSEELNGLIYLKSLKKINPNMSVIGFSGQKNISLALEMIELGAIDYINKDDENFIDNLIESVKKTIEFKESGKKMNSINKSIKSNQGQLWLILLIGLTAFTLSFFTYNPSN